MDCDFFEQTYYYTRPGPQGEISSNDDLSWLIHPILIDSPDPKEQVGESTDVVSENIISPFPSSPVPPVEHLELQEVNSDDLSVIENSCDNIVNIDVSNRYELPPRSTRGIPPKRYDPEFEAQRSKYPINKEGIENLSQSAMAFNTALYSSDIPRSVEEALQDSKWRKAMEEEISTLDKNKN